MGNIEGILDTAVTTAEWAPPNVLECLCRIHVLAVLSVTSPHPRLSPTYFG